MDAASSPIGTFVPRDPMERNAPNPGWGGSTFDSSSVTFDARALLIDTTSMKQDQTAINPSGRLTLDAGHSAKLSFFLNIDATQDNLAIPIIGGNDSFTQQIVGSWDVSASPKGALSISGMLSMDGPSSTDTDYSVQPPNDPVIDEAKGTILIKVVVTGKTTSTTTGGSVALEKEGKGGVGLERTRTNQTGPSNVQQSFLIKIDVVNIPKEPPPAEPKGTVKVLGASAIIDAEFVVGPFKTGKAKELDRRKKFDPGSATYLAAGSVEEAINQLYSSLPKGTRKSIDNGKLPGDEIGEGMRIEIHGYASNTDSKVRNFKLSLGRAQAVRDAFKSFGVPDEVFQQAHPHGEWETRNEKQGMVPTDERVKEKESADWRKVVIKMRYTVSVPGPDQP